MLRRFCFIFVWAAFFIPLAIVPPANAITIDQLTETQSAVLLGSGQTSISSIVSGSSILGGTRGLLAKKAAVPGNLLVAVGEGRISHSQDSQVSGSSTFSWDGDNNPIIITPNGLGSVNFTTDGGSAMKVVVDSFDYPFNQPVSLIFTVYDSHNPSVDHYSRGRVSLNSAIGSPTTFLIPFSTFTEVGLDGSASFSSIGALSLVIDGVNPAIDLTISYLGTNGGCSHVPVGGLILDQCGICNGDNSSCSDCEGVPFGPKGPGTFCPTGQLGICGNGTYSEECSCVQSKQPSTEICNHLDDNCDGLVDEKLFDACGICGGNGSSCLSCTSSNQDGLQTLLDQGAKKQEKLIQALIREYKKLPQSKGQQKWIAYTLAHTHELQILNWTISWRYPTKVIQCTNPSSLCVQTSFEFLTPEYKAHSEELRQIGLDALARLGKLHGALKKRAAKYLKNIEIIHARNMRLLGTIVDVSYVCK